MEFENIKYELNEGVLMITLNRPEKLNAFKGSMMNELIEAFNQADRDDEIRVIIVTGAGRAFCAGEDMSSGQFDFASRSKEPPQEQRGGGGLLVLRIFEMMKPIIAAINGPAVGIGITMTLPMDIRIASENAKIGFVFTRRGLVPEACSSWFLPRIVGINRALEWVVTGRVFSAQEALENRLVSRVVSPDKLLSTAQELAKEIASNTSAVSVALSRQLLWRMLGAGHPVEARKIDLKCTYYMAQSPDGSEGIASFLEKRPPMFRMKPSINMPNFYPWWAEPPTK
jgi:enoyl-CoA hydratase/carnithine racemase